ncbi:hypothetical protein C3B55_00568 [Candidatus Pseudomonas adelgestsugas]|uniref:Uncharacterized protein n=1 Tax=Candidatus Pseudomonas adelgestsugas TaxID=1302376 RepID=A0ABX5R902_9PSED|nr:hypothetical protein C3B55_00568 [Candidatus Pseudomonas adelgestsugas]
MRFQCRYYILRCLYMFSMFRYDDLEFLRFSSKCDLVLLLTFVATAEGSTGVLETGLSDSN